jgi:hypothetical protein
MLEEKFICHSISADKGSSAVRFFQPSLADAQTANIIVEIKFSDPGKAKEYEPGKVYNILINDGSNN